MRNIKLVLAYDGTRYKGWQRLEKADSTIQGRVEAVLTRLLGEPIEITGSGRTDAGVHALGQVASFHCQSAMSCGEILQGLGRYLPEDIGVLSCEEASDRFHARYNAKAKTYRYRVWNNPEPCVFLRNQVYRVEAPLDLAAMKQAASLLMGRHDFRAFSSVKNQKKSTVRTLYALDICPAGPEVHITVTADGFLYNMVRILTGTLLEVGMHRLAPEDIPGILAGGERSAAGYTVPPRGLALMEVSY